MQVGALATRRRAGWGTDALKPKMLYYSTL